MKILSESRLTQLLTLIKNNFFRKSEATEVEAIDLTEVETLDIDNAPTANSNNLVTSGGVKAAIDAIPSGGGSSNVFYCTCSTGASTAAKVATLVNPTSGFTLTAGVSVIVKFTSANSAATPTLNVASTGAKGMMMYGTTKMSSTTSTSGWLAGSSILLTYDGTNWVRNYWYERNNAEMGHGFGTCSTAATTIAKTVSISGYTLIGGSDVTVKFNNAVPANATLNVSSNGAKPIYWKGKAITSGVIKAGDTAFLVYNGTQFHLLAVDSSIPDPPITFTVDLSNVSTGDADSYGTITLYNANGGQIASIDWWGEDGIYDTSYANVATIKMVYGGNNISNESADVTIDDNYLSMYPMSGVDGWEGGAFTASRFNASGAGGMGTPMSESSIMAFNSISCASTCVTGDTLILCRNNHTVPIKRLQEGVDIASINPQTMEIEYVPITRLGKPKSTEKIETYYFSDGSFVKIVGKHRFWRKESNSMEYLQDFNIGDHTVNNNKEFIELVSKEIADEATEQEVYFIQNKYHNYFCNGLMSGDKATREMHFDENEVGE